MEHASLLRKHQAQGAVSLTMEVEDLSRYEGRASRAYYRAANMLMKLQAVRQKQQQQQNSEPQVEEQPAEQSPSQPLRTKGVKPPAHAVTPERRSNPLPPGESLGPRPLPDAA